MGMELRAAFCRWQEQYKNGWGLAWYLASELCERFYRSHGIVPHVILFEPVGGYYGISLNYVSCSIHGENKESIGRMTMAGDAEDWKEGFTKSRSLALAGRAASGESVESLLGEAIRFLGIPPYPEASHVNCRHKRWGGSFVLVFQIASLIALQYNNESGMDIWTKPSSWEEMDDRLDAKKNLREHPGYIEMTNGQNRIVVAGDGRVLIPSGVGSLWEAYLQGDSLSTLTERCSHYLTQGEGKVF